MTRQSAVTFNEFFVRATGLTAPYPYQQALAEGRWPDLLDVATGLGKTAAVTLGWLYRRQIRAEADIPRRLVWCLPMRVLVEQTARSVRSWLNALELLGEPGDAGRVSVNLLMGGEPDARTAPWTTHPEQDAVLIGTQDMLLSRALMRGYGMSRYQWPVHFALLHNDALWVFDEVQLMGPALSTSSQLEGLRRSGALTPARPARSLWVSATLNSKWLDTVDLRPHAPTLHTLKLSEDEIRLPAIRKRREANKRLRPARTRLLVQQATKAGRDDYARELAAEVLEAHVAGTTTLVVLNTVDRAQAVFDALRSGPVATFLVHGRFRPAERREIDARLKEPTAEGRIIVATQAIEAGVDLTSRVLFTELAPWPSLVQRFGRCNRHGEESEADVFWIDQDGDEKLAAPYAPASLEAARARLDSLASASPADLAPTDEPVHRGLVLRQKDLLQLFNTEPDLSGIDIDISVYVRDVGTPQLHVFWREFTDAPGSEGQPRRDDLCPASVRQVREHVVGKRQAYVWDSLAGAWRLAGRDLRPGMTLLLRASDGGYDAERGFSPGARAPVPLVGEPDAGPADYDAEVESAIGRFVELTEHLRDVAAEARRLAHLLDLDDATAASLVTAARWHDVGKAHPAFQRALRKAAAHAPEPDGTLWAKSDGDGRLDYDVPGPDGKPVRRRHFRHELASMLAWLDQGAQEPQHDLIAYLIAAHHGKVRMGLRALPSETVPDNERRFARGVWEGDVLPEVRLNGEVVPETALRLDVMELGTGAQGPSWTERTQRLLATWGPFRLGWLEALLRIADWRASQMERTQATGELP